MHSGHASHRFCEADRSHSIDRFDRCNPIVERSGPKSNQFRSARVLKREGHKRVDEQRTTVVLRPPVSSRAARFRHLFFGARLALPSFLFLAWRPRTFGPSQLWNSASKAHRPRSSTTFSHRHDLPAASRIATPGPWRASSSPASERSSIDRSILPARDDPPTELDPVTSRFNQPQPPTPRSMDTRPTVAADSSSTDAQQQPRPPSRFTSTGRLNDYLSKVRGGIGLVKCLASTIRTIDRPIDRFTY